MRRTDRIDDISGQRSESIVVLDFTRFRQTVWNADRREYIVHRMNRSAPTVPSPAHQLVLDRVTKDTGDRRVFFGRVARHLVTQETLRDTSFSKDALPTRKTDKDGWYVDSDSLPRWVRGRSVHFLAVGGTRPSLTIKQTGPKPTGLAVWEKETSSYSASNGQPEASDRTIEVTELVEAPLPSELFAPPHDFKRVGSFPGDVPLGWEEQLKLEWEWLQEWLEDVVP